MLQQVDVSPARRRALRRSVHVTCDVISIDWDEPVAHLATDLSPFGAFLDTPFPLPEGTEVAVAFTPPRWAKGREVVAFARVRRRVRAGARRGMGLEFIDLCADDLAELSQTLRGLPPPLVRGERPKARELVWVDTMLTWEEDLGDRVNTYSVSEMIGVVAEDELDFEPLATPLAC